MNLIILFKIDTIPVGFSGWFSLIRKCAINFYVFYRWCKPTKQMCMQLEILLNSHSLVLKTKMLTSSIGRWHMHMVHKFDFLQKSLCMNIECATNYTCMCLDCLGWLSLILSSSGKTAALGILGRDEPIRSVPFFWTVQYKKSIRYTGTSMICVPVSFLWITIHRLNLQIKC